MVLLGCQEFFNVNLIQIWLYHAKCTSNDLIEYKGHQLMSLEYEREKQYKMPSGMLQCKKHVDSRRE